MDSISNGIDRVVEEVFAWLPELIGALIILIIGNWIAKAVSKAVKRFLQHISLDDRLYEGQGGSFIQKAVPSPQRLLSTAVYWLLFVGAISLAATVLGIDALNDLIASIYGYVPQIIAAILIFLAGSAVAAGVTTLVRNTMGDTPTGKMIESIAPVIVIGITLFMILDQLGIASVIVTITYAALVGGVALSTALAFGLGGRDVAARLLDAMYEKGQQNADQVKADLQIGKERAKNKVEKVKRRNS